ncbi:MAG TPA: DOMON-like domain-containing protein [Steroidobacteraceae bacterium]|jgi:hypothetical protein
MDVLPLTCHPSTPCPYVQAVSVRVDRMSADLLVLYYRVEADLDRLRLPPQRPSGHADELWRHTCFEAFLRSASSPGYFELNFSPSSEWAAYRFDDYRLGMRVVVPERPPRVVCRRREDALEADVDLHLGALLDHASLTSRPLRLAITTVLEDADGRLSYWALAHAPGKPDFHHAAGFTLDLPPYPEAE